MTVNIETSQESVTDYMERLGQAAGRAARELGRAVTSIRNEALTAIAGAIEQARPTLAEANARDLRAGERSGLEAALLDRLELTDARISAMAEGLRQIAALPDPIGRINGLECRPSGIQVGRMRVPLGVVGIIYESRPNVTADAAGLCLKSGNATILRGGSEALHSNQAVADCIVEGLDQVGLPAACVQVVGTTDRAAVGALIRMREHVDVIVPRGGKGLIQRISDEARVPVIKHLDGVCHTYIDDQANVEMAVEIAFNAKTQRYGTCNTMETLLVARGIAARVLPELGRRYCHVGVVLRGCPETCALLPESSPADAEDWDTEYLAPLLSIRIVDDLDQAMQHIAEHGSQHTDAIVTDSLARARRFLREVDSSSVMVNASTRFADGFEYGLGAEIGVSTDKLHARGPVGVLGLTTEKFVVLGDGHVRR